MAMREQALRKQFSFKPLERRYIALGQFRPTAFPIASQTSSCGKTEHLTMCAIGVTSASGNARASSAQAVFLQIARKKHITLGRFRPTAFPIASQTNSCGKPEHLTMCAIGVRSASGKARASSKQAASASSRAKCESTVSSNTSLV